MAHHGETHSQCHERQYQPTDAAQKQHAPPGPVQQKRGNQNGNGFHEPNRHRREEKVVIGFDSGALEDSRAVQNDGVDARGLREEVNPERRDEDMENRARGVEEKLFPYTLPVTLLVHQYDVVVAVLRDPSRLFYVG